MTNHTTLGEFLQALRKSRRLTMQQATHNAGIHRATLHRWESGQVQPRLPELEALLGVLEASQAQKRQAVLLVEAPRAQTLVRLDRERIAIEAGLGPMPHGGNLLYAMRLRRGWSLDDVASRLGVTTKTLRRWEKTETWPSVEHLHLLCYTLNATVEEALALTCGLFAPSLWTATTTNPAKAARELAERVEQCSQSLYEPPFGLKDLQLLTLQAQAWTMASHSASGCRLLVEVHALTCHFFSYRDRYREALVAARRYFDLVSSIPEDTRGQSAWLNIRLATITNRLRLPGLTTPNRSLKELRHILPLARGTRHEAGALIRISQALLLEGATGKALQISQEACEAAERTLGVEGATMIRGGLGIQLIECERYAEGLPLLSTGNTGDWYRLVETSLWKAEALLGLGEKTEAQHCLTQAQTDLTRYEMTPLQPRLNRLLARLQGEAREEVAEG